MLNMPAIKNNCIKNKENDITNVKVNIGRKIIKIMLTYYDLKEMNRISTLAKFEAKLRIDSRRSRTTARIKQIF